jgi:REP-associated tyrosine transposase
MARLPRLVVPGYPHHVTQRGNRRQTTFFSGDDYRRYITYISAAKVDAGADIWAWCLMPNHVHLIVVPERRDSLSALFAEAHRNYTRFINFRHDWHGHLWQGRFYSCVMDEEHLLAAVRYVELNPVTAGLCQQPEEWPWSSSRAHLAGRDDVLVSVAPMLERTSNWRRYLQAETSESTIDSLHKHSRTGRPLGGDHFIEKLEQITKTILKPGRPGPKANK